MSICGECQQKIGACSWSREFKPVPGWTATPTKVLMQSCISGRTKKSYADSYDVTDCPLYIPPKKGRERVRKYNKNSIIAENIVTHEITKYTSVRKACDSGGFEADSVRAVLEGRQRTHYGYYFYYEGGE